MNFFSSLLNSMPGALSLGMIWGIMAIGVYITYKVLNVSDLTVDGTLCTGAAVCVVSIINGVPTWLAIIMAILAGMLCGLVTGLLTTKLKIPAILAGILTQLALYSINLHIMAIGSDSSARNNLPISVDNYDLLVSSRFVSEVSLRNPLIVITIFIVLIIALLYWFFGTEVGCGLRATGANEEMSRAQGINTNTSKVLGIMVANGLVALSGALLAQYQGFADINMGRGAIVIGLAAVIIGEVIFGKIFNNFALKLLACVFGAMIYYIVIQFVLKLGLSTDDLKLLSAVVVAIFLSIPYLKEQIATKRKERLSHVRD